MAAPLFFVRNDQVNAQVPYSVAGKTTAELQVRYQGVASNVVTMPIAASAPGIFALAGGKNQAVALNQDGTLNSPANPAEPASIVILYTTGEGQTNPPGVTGKLADPPFPEPRLPVSVSFSDIRAEEILFAAGAPGFTGLMQINVRIPPGVNPGAALPVVLRVGEGRSQPEVTIAIASPFVISNLRATARNTRLGPNPAVELRITVDFVDPSGAATQGDLRINFDINDGELEGFGDFLREGVTPGQTSGAMMLSFTFPFARLRLEPGQTVPITISLVNSAGIESNQAAGVLMLVE